TLPGAIEYLQARTGVCGNHTIIGKVVAAVMTVRDQMDLRPPGLVIHQPQARKIIADLDAIAIVEGCFEVRHHQATR
ncbi:MAG: hypothetical protein JF596_13780, partial [Stenotrophomonas sp.]|nr:hypothetical protein [Stenotrophomonas sp.]